jgi:Coenzyme PQQ synthesis protein D (PqqD)
MPGDLAADTTLVAIADQASVDLDDEAAILHLKTGVYFGLNEVGAWIWRLIQEPRTVAQVRAAVLGEFDVEPERCDSDLQALLRDLAQHQLIEIHDAGPA